MIREHLDGAHKFRETVAARADEPPVLGPAAKKALTAALVDLHILVVERLAAPRLREAAQAAENNGNIFLARTYETAIGLLKHRELIAFFGGIGVEAAITLAARAHAQILQENGSIPQGDAIVPELNGATLESAASPMHESPISLPSAE